MNMQFTSLCLQPGVIIVWVLATCLGLPANGVDSRAKLIVEQQSGKEPTSAESHKPAIVPLGIQTDRALQLDLLINGESICQIESRVLTSLFQHFDLDENGTLESEEFLLVPDLSQLEQQLWNPLGARQNQWVDLDTIPSFASPSEFITWFRQLGYGFVHVGVGRDSASAMLSRKLRDILDKLHSDAASYPTKRLLLERFEQLDQNDDRQLSADELIRDLIYPSCSTSQLINSNQRFEKPDRLEVNVLLPSQPDNPDYSTPFQQAVVSKPLPTVRIRYDSGTSEQHCKTAELFLEQLFKTIDTDKDDQLSATELTIKKARLMRNLKTFADRNRDGAIGYLEMVDWLKVWGKIVRAQIRISVLEQPIGLWELLDTDLDGHLSPIEWSATARNKGDLGFVNVPQRMRKDQIRITISHGQPRTGLNQPLLQGPAWFRAADTNRDRHLQIEEFVGPLQTFRLFDKNSDGMISIEEIDR